MIRKTFGSLSIVALAYLMLIPAMAFAQSSIAGAVKDTTGAVLPGVTVEAASPALIEKVRTVATDDQGQYKIVDLRPGIYAVTFSLTGFNTVKREGIELTTNFTANVSAELRVGALEETVTVSGQTPIVDVQNVVQQRVITKDIIDALPTARTYMAFAAVIPGITVGAVVRLSGQDVGGSAGDQSQTLAIHGGRPRDMQNMIEGMLWNNTTGVWTPSFFVDTGAMQEISYELGAISTDTTSGGVHTNLIPKDGGNRFTGSVFATFTNHSLQSDNTTPELLARGLGAINHLDKIWDVNPSFGGPMKHDRVWFYASGRYWGLDDRVAGMWYNKTPTAFVYTPDYSRQAIDDSWLGSGSLRLTWQATPKNKVAAFFIDQGRCLCHSPVSTTVAPEASRQSRSPVTHTEQVTWSAPVTNRLLLEAGFSRPRFEQSPRPQPGTEDLLSVRELSTGLNFRAPALGLFRHDHWVYNYKAALSYVTGSHAVKVGFNLQAGHRIVHQSYAGDINLELLNGVPNSIIENATPYVYRLDLNSALGIYAQDQWTLKRLTLNLGLRYDHHNESNPEQHLGPVRFVGPRDFAAVPDVPNWNDVNPRLGASYDLLGNGKTALKVALSRYGAGEMVDFATANNPVITSVNSATRTWNDLNGDFNPDCNFLNPAPNGECGALSDANFGNVKITTRYDDAVRQGWGSRGFNWETSAGVQRELLPRVSANATYFRRWYGNFTVTDNLAVTPANYDPYCITAAVDARLPGGGGNQICGLYNISPARFGQVNNLVTFAKNFGTQWEHYNGVDLTVNARLPNGAMLAGGLNAGRSETNNCFVVDSPDQLRFCDIKPPFQPQVKFLGTYSLPWDLQASGTFQSLPGPQITASYPAPNAEIAPSLGRNLAAGARATATVDLIQPGTLYDTRLYQLDVRLSKIFKIRRTRIQANFDLYNALNASPVLALNNTYGPAWQRPTYVLPGRLFKFGGQVDF